jgi:ABC-type phosphate/phosphonate transport system substrate-binding protein
MPNGTGTVSDEKVEHLLASRLKDTGLGNSNLTLRSFSRSIECSTLSRRTIATLNASAYLRCSQAVSGDSLIPLFFVEKSGEKSTRYAAAFIAGTHSPITALNPGLIERLVLGPPSSASSFTAPLYRLWQLKLLDSPTPQAAAQRGWNVDTVTDARAIRREVAEDPVAVGSVGLPPAGNSDDPSIRVLSRYAYLPQDVLFISSDLNEHRSEIERWLSSLLQDSLASKTLRNHASAISGLVPYKTDIEAKQALNDLAVMRRAVSEHSVPSRPKLEWSTERWIPILTGLALIVAGLSLMSRAQKEGANTLKLPGIEISVSSPAMMLILVGVVLILIGVGVLQLLDRPD